MDKVIGLPHGFSPQLITRKPFILFVIYVRWKTTAVRVHVWDLNHSFGSALCKSPRSLDVTNLRRQAIGPLISASGEIVIVWLLR